MGKRRRPAEQGQRSTVRPTLPSIQPIEHYSSFINLTRKKTKDSPGSNFAEIAAVQQANFGKKHGVGESDGVEFLQLELHLKLVTLLLQHKRHFTLAFDVLSLLSSRLAFLLLRPPLSSWPGIRRPTLAPESSREPPNTHTHTHRGNGWGKKGKREPNAVDTPGKMPRNISVKIPTMPTETPTL